MENVIEEVKAEATKVETKVKTVAEAVVADVKEEASKVEPKAKAALVQVSADEKLFLSDTELEFLKTQMEIQRLTKIAEAKSKSYTDYIEGLYKKYALTKVEYLFDGGVRAFKAIESKL
jgi:hypothetical protein